MNLLQGRCAIITGAASVRGLGKAMARLFAEHGAIVAIVDLDVEAARAAALDIGPQHLGLACDVSDKDACESLVAELVARWGQVDVLVNNAGISQPLKIMEITPQDYDAVLDVSLRGTLYMSQALIPTLRDQKSGSIINISSVSAQQGGGIFGGPHYSAAKAGVLGLTKAMARELAPDNVRVNAVCPGFIDTDIYNVGKATQAMRLSALSRIPMGRAGKAEEVAGCCLFLASELSAYVTGSEVDCNGGSLIH